MPETAYFFLKKSGPPLAERVRVASSCSTFTHTPVLGRAFVSTWILINCKSWWIWSRVRTYQGASWELSFRNRADLAESSPNGNRIEELLASRSVELSRILLVSAAFSHVPYPKCPISYWMYSWGYSDGIIRSVWTAAFSLPLCRKLSSQGDLCPRNNNGVCVLPLTFSFLVQSGCSAFSNSSGWLGPIRCMFLKNQSDGLMSHGRLSRINQIRCFLQPLICLFLFLNQRR